MFDFISNNTQEQCVQQWKKNIVYGEITSADVQEDKLVEEIDQNNWKDINADDTYDKAMNLPYLDMFIREVLRMYPITTKALARECNTTTVVCGHTIEEGGFCRGMNITHSIICLQIVSFNRIF